MSQSTPNDTEIIPFAILLVSLIFGGYVVWNRPFDRGAAYIWIIILVLSIGGVAYVAWRFNSIRQEDGIDAAVSWLFSEFDDGQSRSTATKSNNDTEPTPPPTEQKKNELYFERADRCCEWCGERVDSPDVHHIKPRSTGGSNSPKNLIVLCPTCHRKADRGAISRSKLKYKVREQVAGKES